MLAYLKLYQTSLQTYLLEQLRFLVGILVFFLLASPLFLSHKMFLALIFVCEWFPTKVLYYAYQNVFYIKKS